MSACGCFIHSYFYQKIPLPNQQRLGTQLYFLIPSALTELHHQPQLCFEAKCLMMWMYDVDSIFLNSEASAVFAQLVTKQSQRIWQDQASPPHSLFLFLHFKKVQERETNYMNIWMKLESVTWNSSFHWFCFSLIIYLLDRMCEIFVLAVPVAPAAASKHFLCPQTGRTQPTPRQCVPSFILPSPPFSSVSGLRCVPASSNSVALKRSGEG